MKKLCTLAIGAFTYRVFSADPSEVDGFKPEMEGYTRYDDCCIFIHKELHPSRFKDVIVHEALHAIFDASGVHYLLELYLPEGGDARDIMEELMIRAITPMLITTLRQIPKVLK